MAFDEINKKEIAEKLKIRLKIIGDTVKRERLKNNLTQQDLAFYIFSDKSFISNLERGKSTNLTLKKIIEISVVLKTNLEDYFR